jgi:hypothetical protein
LVQLLVKRREFVTERGDRACHVRPDGARRDAEHLRSAARVQVEVESQDDDLTLPQRQPRQGGQRFSFDRSAGASVASGRGQLRVLAAERTLRRRRRHQTGPRQDATSLNQGHCGSPEDNPVLILLASDPRFTQS